MASMPPYSRFERIIDRTTGLFLAAGLIWLPAMMILTVGDVFGRYLFSAPIPGSRELNELMLLSMVVFGLGHCHREKGNVKITLLSDFLPARARAFLDMSAGFLGMFISGTLAACSFIAGIDEFYVHTSTDMLGIPLFPFKFILGAGCLCFFLAILIDFLKAVHSFFKVLG